MPAKTIDIFLFVEILSLLGKYPKVLVTPEGRRYSIFEATITIVRLISLLISFPACRKTQSCPVLYDSFRTVRHKKHATCLLRQCSECGSIVKTRTLWLV
jgi:hypothetical protein